MMSEPAQLLLKRASASRPSGKWNDDDFDVLCDGLVVGRLFKSDAAPVGMPWLWVLAFEHYADRSPRLRCDARGRDGGIRKELATGIKLKDFAAELTGSRRGTLSRIEYGKLKQNHA